ncbi:hypothetical protein [Acinetobacter puyangensis]|uniref:hypothetical protein n=1 Tax=Acinetobacter puyangensis TaxID=1096779 RepID=UPI003A4E2CBA
MLLIFKDLKKYFNLLILLGVASLLQSCGNAITNSNNMNTLTCNTIFDEKNKDLKQAPCLQLPISSIDFENLPKLENGWYDLDKTKFTTDKNEFFALKSHSLAQVVGYIPVENDAFYYAIIIQNIDMEGDGPEQVFSLLHVNNSGIVEGGIYIGTQRFNFSKDIGSDSEMEQIDFKKIANIPYHGQCKQDFVINKDFTVITTKKCTNKKNSDLNFTEVNHYKLDTKIGGFKQISTNSMKSENEPR